MAEDTLRLSDAEVIQEIVDACKYVMEPYDPKAAEQIAENVLLGFKLKRWDVVGGLGVDEDTGDEMVRIPEIDPASLESRS